MRERTESSKEMEDPTIPSRDYICGVDRDLVERFLILIRDNYKKADKATFFLEQKAGVANLQGMANIRDVLSHLVTMLDPSTPESEKENQIANAEEHLRRAIIEPYEIAVNDLVVRFGERFDEYKAKVVPLRTSNQMLQSAPSAEQITRQLREIHALIALGRSGKAHNVWTPQWEESVSNLIDAYDRLYSLSAELEQQLNLYSKIRDKDSTRLQTFTHLFGYVLALLTLFGTMAMIFKPSILEYLRTLLGLK